MSDDLIEELNTRRFATWIEALDWCMRAANEIAALRASLAGRDKRIADLEAAGYGKPIVRRVERPPLTIYGDAETSIGWENSAPDASAPRAPTDTFTIRVCPMRDATCPHGMACPYTDGWDCKPGWNSLAPTNTGEKP